MLKISVIIPVYNVEKYIEKCINSVLAQTFTNFECILINDGSLDNSGKICDEYAIKDERIKIVHQKNGGVSSARNAGLDVALGEWVTFVDSDDWVEQNYLELMYNNAINNDCDLSICGIQSFAENGEFIEKSKRTAIIFFDKISAKKTLLDFKYFTTAVVSKLVRRKYINEYNIRFDSEIKVCEDGLFWFEVIDKINKVLYDSTICYNYLRNSTSSTFSENYFINYMDVFIATKKMLLLEKNEAVRNKIKSYEASIANGVCYTMTKKKIINKEYYRFYSNTIRKNLLFFLLDSDVPIKYKIMAFLAFCPICYKNVMQIANK